MLLFLLILSYNYTNYKVYYLILFIPMNKNCPMDLVRNFGIMAHIDAGKTTTTERVLFYTGLIHRIGEVHEGAATTDYMEQERERGITIQSAAVTAFWERFCNKYRINIIDTPGHVDFTIEVERSLRVLDGAVAVFDGSNGVEPQSETVWRQADKYKVPRICFINKMDKLGADYEMCLRSIVDRLGVKPLALHYPIGEGSDFKGVIDIVRMKAVYWNCDDNDEDCYDAEIPDNLKHTAIKYRDNLLEALSDVDEQIMEWYLAGQHCDITEEMIRSAIRKSVISLAAFPVLCGTAFKHKGVRMMLDAVIDFLPSPKDLPDVEGFDPDADCDADGKQIVLYRKRTIEEKFSGLAFKVIADPHGILTFVRIYSGRIEAGTSVINSTKDKKERVGRIVLMHADKKEEIKSASAGEIVAFIGLKDTTTGDTLCDMDYPIVLEKMIFPEPVISIAIEPCEAKDRDRFSIGIGKLVSEDPSLRVHFDEESGQTILSGMGELHLEIILDRLKREHKCVVTQGQPQVAYRETIAESTCLEHEYTHKKQSGGAGQYGKMVAIIRSNRDGSGFKFINSIRGGAIPSEYIPAVEKGLRSSILRGALAGYPVVDIEVELVDGAYHDVDSSAMAFEICARVWLTDVIKKLTATNKAYLIEPIMAVEVITPEDYNGDVIGNLNSRRGQICDSELRGNAYLIKANVPLAGMFGYINDLRSRTQGRATFSMSFNHYDRVPFSIQEGLLKKTTENQS